MSFGYTILDKKFLKNWENVFEPRNLKIYILVFN